MAIQFIMIFFCRYIGNSFVDVFVLINMFRYLWMLPSLFIILAASRVKINLRAHALTKSYTSNRGGYSGNLNLPPRNMGGLSTPPLGITF